VQKVEKRSTRKPMGARRDDIVSNDRAQIAIQVLSPDRPRGRVTELAKAYEVTRQTIYDISAAGERVLREGLEPGPHGPQPREPKIEVTRDRMVRSTVVLTGAGVSQRDVQVCLEEMLDSSVSLGWVNGELAKAETKAEQVNAEMEPQVEESLSGDELYANGEANLLLVGNDSLYIYELSRQAECDGEAWGCVLLDAPESAQFASDAGTALAAGVEAAGIEVHQLDWDHLLRPMWGQATRLEKQGYAVLKAVEARAVQFEQSHTAKRLKQHLAKWEELCQEAEQVLARHDDFLEIARAVDEQFTLIDLETGQLRDPAAGAATLRELGLRLSTWTGRIYQKLSRNLSNWADGLFAYQPVLAGALAPLIDRWGAPAIQALARIWQVETDEKRRPLPLVEQHARQRIWETCLDTAVDLLGLDQLWAAWDALSDVLNKSWRGSMLAECINSLLRPVLDRRKHTDQGCLELFRFLHNTHTFARGKRAGHSPAALAGIHIPVDPLVLLGLPPKCQSNSLGF
jgi:hypothetical protein